MNEVSSDNKMSEKNQKRIKIGFYLMYFFYAVFILVIGAEEVGGVFASAFLLIYPLVLLPILIKLVIDKKIIKSILFVIIAYIFFVITFSFLLFALDF